MLSTFTSSGARRSAPSVSAFLNSSRCGLHTARSPQRTHLFSRSDHLRPTAHAPAFRRPFQHLAQQPPPPPSKPPPSTSSKDAPTSPTVQADSALKTAQSIGSDTKHLTPAEQRRKDWAIIRRLAVNIWPANDWRTRSRVLLGLGLLVAGKVRTRPWPASVDEG